MGLFKPLSYSCLNFALFLSYSVHIEPSSSARVFNIHKYPNVLSTEPFCWLLDNAVRIIAFFMDVLSATTRPKSIYSECLLMLMIFIAVFTDRALVPLRAAAVRHLRAGAVRVRPAG